ncbi:endonuclease MutS2 [bacterium]|nr:endonuclease MutS2 [bacterium]
MKTDHEAEILVDQTTFESLEFPQLQSLLADLTQTPQGRALVMMIAPSTNPDHIKRQLDELDEYLVMRAMKGGFRFEGMIELEGHFREVAAPGSTLSPVEILDIYQILVLIEALKGMIRKREAEFPLLGALIGQTDALPAVRALIERTISPNAELLDDASVELKRIRLSIQKNRDRIYRSLERFIARADIAPLIQDNVITQRNQRFVIPVKIDGKAKVKGIIHDQSSSGVTIFVEPMGILPLNNAFLQDKLAEEKEIKRLLRLLADRCRENLDQLRVNIQVLARIDLIQAKAVFADRYEATRPTLSDQATLEIYNARHPLLTHYLTREHVVPIDILVNGQERLLLITGPNMGGKTVALKTAGLLCLMVQSGMFVPAAQRSTFPVFQSVFTDIGDLQDMSQSLSTFASHLLRIKTILDQAGQTSLVLLDELGTGTDPDEGAALGQMILDEMYQRQAITIATTHLSHLKQRTYQRSERMVASVQFDLELTRPTYRLKYGQYGESNAFTIAQNLGISAHYIAKARSCLNPVQVRLNELAELLENRQRELEKSEKKLSRKHQALHTMKENAEKRAQEIILEAGKQASKLLDQVRQRVRYLHSELGKYQPDRAGLEKTRDQLVEIQTELDQILPAPAQAEPPVEEETPVEVQRPLAIGDQVELEGLGKTGTVLELIEAKQTAVIALAGKTMRVPLHNLKLVGPAQDRTAAQPHVSFEHEIDRGQVPTKITLLGERVDQALSRLDRFLNDAFIYGHARIVVVHGIGEERLRPAIHQFLEENPMVQSFRSGDRVEGGYGVTVVELVSK